MRSKLLLNILFISGAFAVLIISVMRTASVKYDFKGEVCEPKVLGTENFQIDYNLAYPGKVMPDSFLWSIKAFRDKVWLLITTDDGKKADLKLLFADKRIGMAQELFKKGDAETGFSTLTKAEKYLEDSYNQGIANKAKGIDTLNFNKRLLVASLKHYQVLQSINDIAPEDAKPKITEYENYPIRIYLLSKNEILERGEVDPINPFNWK